MSEVGERFEELVSIVKQLRAPEGCPWDREQTNRSLLPYFLEEAYELIESVDQEDWQNLKEELGDILLHAVFQAAIAEAESRFKLSESLEMITEKLVRRHPHVFGEAQAEAPFHAKQNWEAAKHREKGRRSRLDGVPVTLPALIRAQRLQQKASYTGFDWEQINDVWKKIHEEIDELKAAQQEGNKKQIEDEIGDVLFAVVNLARFLEISAEDALRGTNRKFVNRFQQIEAELKRRGKTVDDSTLAEMDAIWDHVKSRES